MPRSILQQLIRDLPHLRTQMYFRSTLRALSQAMEDLVFVGAESPLIIANFRHENFFRADIRRYEQLAQVTPHVFALAVPESESVFSLSTSGCKLIPLQKDDELAQEWILVILGREYAATIVGREQASVPGGIVQMERFEGFWSFDRAVAIATARLLNQRILDYRSELGSKLEMAWTTVGLLEQSDQLTDSGTEDTSARIFGTRLVNYLQAGQYKLLKAYQAISAQEKRERLINAITFAIRNSLTPQVILQTTVLELGRNFANSRCVLYQCQATDSEITIEYDYSPDDLPSLKGNVWPLAQNPLVQVAFVQNRATAIADIENASNLQLNSLPKQLAKDWQIRSWLLVPVRYQGEVLGMIEVHSMADAPQGWDEHDIALVEAIATQVGVALTQAQTVTNLEKVNEQLQVIERSQRNLIAIVGHELRTPLSTIQVCLESIGSETDMPRDILKIMVDAALSDSERMSKLIQNFLRLSTLESQQAVQPPETIKLREIVDISLSSLQPIALSQNIPTVLIELPKDLPWVEADGEGLVEVFSHLLENAFKFTPPDGRVVIKAHPYEISSSETPKSSLQGLNRPIRDKMSMLEVIIADTGRGIDAQELDMIFNRFSQAEDFMKRSTNGAGLGLAICRQIVQGFGGQIWAVSEGENKGSQFHFTVPIAVLSELIESL